MVKYDTVIELPNEEGLKPEWLPQDIVLRITKKQSACRRHRGNRKWFRMLG